MRYAMMALLMMKRNSESRKGLFCRRATVECGLDWI
jgi:hypothetical protein